jgi:esterase/lipase superfamily enzyme
MMMRTIVDHASAAKSAKRNWQQSSAVAHSGDAIVCNHGFNVSFRAASLCAAQIGADLGLDGVMAVFSWPSRGTVVDYAADEAPIEASEPPIAGFLIEFVERSGAQAVHIIAHSVENRVATSASA